MNIKKIYIDNSIEQSKKWRWKFIGTKTISSMFARKNMLLFKERHNYNFNFLIPMWDSEPKIRFGSARHKGE